MKENDERKENKLREKIMRKRKRGSRERKRKMSEKQ